MIDIVATAGVTFSNQTGLDGRIAKLRLFRVENGQFCVRLAAYGNAAVNQSALNGLTLVDGDAFDLCFESQDRGTISASLTDSTLTTNLAYSAGRTLFKLIAWNPLVTSVTTSVTATVTDVDVTVAQSGGTATAYASQGIYAVAGSSGVAGTCSVTLNATQVKVNGYTNTNPAAPLGIDTGVWVSAQGPGTGTVSTTFTTGTVQRCGLTGVRGEAFAVIGATGQCTLTVSGTKVVDCGARANASNLMEGHGVAFECASRGTMTAQMRPVRAPTTRWTGCSRGCTISSVRRPRP